MTPPTPAPLPPAIPQRLSPPTRLRSHWPFPSFREKQEETLSEIEQAVISGKKFIFLEAPTGSGKSPIAYAMASWMNSWDRRHLDWWDGMRDGGAVGDVYKNENYTPGMGSSILTIQKILQDQYIKSFTDLKNVKGRGAYDCNRPGLEGKGISVDVAPCRQQGKASLPECKGECPYYVAIAEAENADISLFNFQSYLYQRHLGGRFRENKRLLVLDEAHNLEGELLRFSGFTMSDKGMNFRLPLDPDWEMSAAAVMDFLRKNSFIEQVRSKFNDAMLRQDARAMNRWERMGKTWERIQKLVEKDAFVPEIREAGDGSGSRVLELKPLFIKRFFNGLLGSVADHFLLMSATILDFRLLQTNLGLDPADCAFVRVPSTFPKENRPIYFNPVGEMTFKFYPETIPKMVAEVGRMLRHYQDFRGIIHCHSFRIGDAIWKGLSPELRNRVIYQKYLRSADPRAEALEKLASSQNGVILAPAFHEGLDLVDDLSRFQIVCKVPYPDLRVSRQLGERVKDKGMGWRYYQWLTALKLVQCVGRSVRNPDDWANTHILDGSFAQFSHRSRGILPEWFKEAVVR